MQEDKPPIFTTWNQLYAFVIGVFIVLVVLLYFFTSYFS